MATSTPTAPADEPARSSAGSAESPTARGDRGRPRRRMSLHRMDLRGAPYAFIAPFFAVFAAFSFYPLVYTGWISLHRVELSSLSLMEWVAFDNYVTLWEDERFWNALSNTFTIGVISTVPQLLMALGLAHLLNYRLRGSTFFRVAALTPYATSVGAAALVFTMLFERDFGMINWLLSLVGVDNIDWENNKWAAQTAISTIVIWRWTGYNALLYLAAMQAVPRERYEAAAIDGASRWQQFLKRDGPRNPLHRRVHDRAVHDRRHPAVRRASDLRPGAERHHRGSGQPVPDPRTAPVRGGLEELPDGTGGHRRVGDVPAADPHLRPSARRQAHRIPQVLTRSSQP